MSVWLLFVSLCLSLYISFLSVCQSGAVASRRTSDAQSAAPSRRPSVGNIDATGLGVDTQTGTQTGTQGQTQTDEAKPFGLVVDVASPMQTDTQGQTQTQTVTQSPTIPALKLKNLGLGSIRGLGASAALSARSEMAFGSGGTHTHTRIRIHTRTRRWWCRAPAEERACARQGPSRAETRGHADGEGKKRGKNRHRAKPQLAG